MTDPVDHVLEPPAHGRPSRRWASGGDLAGVNFNDDATVLEREDTPPVDATDIATDS